MHLFGLLGTLLFFIGFMIGVYLAYLKLALGIVKITERPLFFFGLLSMIIGTQLFLTGFISELIVRNSSEKNNYQIEKKVGL
jgi:hypothetical protein